MNSYVAGHTHWVLRGAAHRQRQKERHRAVESQNIVCKRLFFHVLDMKLETAFSKAGRKAVRVANKFKKSPRVAEKNLARGFDFWENPLIYYLNVIFKSLN